MTGSKINCHTDVTKFLLIWVLGLFASSTLYSQDVHVGYDAPFNTSVSLMDGDHLLVHKGSNAPFGLARIAPSGNVVWARSITSPTYKMTNIVETVDGDLIGALETPDGPVIFCLDPDGEVVWVNNLAIGTGHMRCGNMVATPDSAIALLGRGPLPWPDTSTYVIKFNTSGMMIWAKQGPFWNQDLMSLGSNGLLISGFDEGSWHFNGKIDNSGIPQWAWRTSFGGDYTMTEVCQAVNGDLYMAYVWISAEGGPEELVVRRSDQNGQIIWDREFDILSTIGGIMPGTRGMVALSDGVVVTPGDQFGFQMHFLRIDSSGTVTWAADLPTFLELTGDIDLAGNDSIWALTEQMSALVPNTEWHRIATDQPPTSCMSVASVPVYSAGQSSQIPVTFTMSDVPVVITPGSISIQAMDVNVLPVCGTVNVPALQHEEIEFELIPNPALDAVTLSTNVEGKVTIRLFDMHGSLLYQVNFTKDNADDIGRRIPIRDLLPGLYLVELSDRHGRRGSERLVVQ